MRVMVDRKSVIEMFEKAIKIDKLNRLIYTLADFLVARNAKYDDAWQLFDLLTPLIRINEKRIRVRRILDANRQAVSTNISLDYVGLARELIDIIGYCVLALLWLSTEHNFDVTVVIEDSND